MKVKTIVFYCSMVALTPSTHASQRMMESQGGNIHNSFTLTSRYTLPADRLRSKTPAEDSAHPFRQQSSGMATWETATNEWPGQVRHTSKQHQDNIGQWQ